MRQYAVLELRLDFRLNLEDRDVARERAEIERSIRCWRLPGRYSKNSISYVILTEETSAELVNRLDLPAIVADDHRRLENYWCNVAPTTGVARYGVNDPFITGIERAWARIRQRRHSDYMRDTQRDGRRTERRVENFPSSTIRKVGVEFPGVRKPPEDTHR